jgi:mRNA interferase RelE/StbE
MASYKVVPKPSVAKDLRSLPKATVARIVEKIEGLGKEPFPPRTVKLEGGEELYRIRIGDYRVVYAVDRGAKQVIVHYVRHRRDAYRKF